MEIDDRIVQDAIEHGTITVRQKSISRLDRHQRILYEVIEQSGNIATSMVYERFRERVRDELDEGPRVDRTLRKYLKKKQQYNLIEASGASQNRAYSVVNS